MITILDEVQCCAGDLPDLLQRFEQDYLPAALERGLILSGQWVSPPVALQDKPNTLWWQWQIADAASYYGMRAGQTQAVADFWATVDEVALERHRHVMVPAGESLPQPLEERS